MGIAKYMAANDLTESQAARELLRQVLGKPAKAIDRGWLEGYAHGYRAYQLELVKKSQAF